jgi:glucose-1-phosphatase
MASAQDPCHVDGAPARYCRGRYGVRVNGEGRVLLVDLGGVLFEFDHGHRLRILGECLGLTPGRVDELLWQSGFSADCDAGRYRSAAAVRRQIRHITGYAGADDDLGTAWCSAFSPDPVVTRLVAGYAGRLGVFTNNGPLEEEVLTRLYPQVFGLFDQLFFGWQLVANKPAAAAYQQVAGLLGVPPAQINFADDNAGNVDAARRCGWNAIYYRSAADLSALLR